MFCINCGTELPDEANFCWKCGRPQKEGVQVKETRWETCEIVYQKLKEPFFGDTEFQFWARAIGPEGSYNAGESPVFKCWSPKPESYSADASNAHKALVSKLLADGWEPTTNSDYSWWGDTFRRRVR
ncbi:MAG: zinc ribbon domain-containing protein [Chloroflexia bacterium]|nr:zinc ribbon domain-containing protein [Chloroflexia bacterium]